MIIKLSLVWHKASFKKIEGVRLCCTKLLRKNFSTYKIVIGKCGLFDLVLYTVCLLLLNILLICPDWISWLFALSPFFWLIALAICLDSVFWLFSLPQRFAYLSCFDIVGLFINFINIWANCFDLVYWLFIFSQYFGYLPWFSILAGYHISRFWLFSLSQYCGYLPYPYILIIYPVSILWLFAQYCDYLFLFSILCICPVLWCYNVYLVEITSPLVYLLIRPILLLLLLLHVDLLYCLLLIYKLSNHLQIHYYTLNNYYGYFPYPN